MLVSDFDYHLPEELIAQEPLADRAASRMLVVRRADHGPRTTDHGPAIADRCFADLPDLLSPGDLLVLNDTRVLRARLFGRRMGVKAQPVSPHNPAARDFLMGQVEVLLTRQLDQQTWEALVHPGRKIGVGERIRFSGGLRATVLSRGTFGERTLHFDWEGDFFQQLERTGHIPLPPYIRREDRPEDAERYQTVFAERPGSVAAPTAGLHFTGEILARLRARGVGIARLTLEVGLGTFQPIRVEEVEQHPMHAERYIIPEETAAAVNRALEEGRRVVAVGTTTVRTLEHAAQQAAARTPSRIQSGHPPSSAAPSSPNMAGVDACPTGPVRIEPGAGDTRLFIYPGFRFRVTGAMLTNFHLPRSTLLMLVCAFAGREHALAAYQHAVARRYRFYSYGDCMLVL